MSSKLAKSAGLIGAATTVSRVLGLVRDSVMAKYFGASVGMEMDAFNVAFRIPNLLRDLFAEGAMTSAFVPAFTRTLTAHGKEAAWRLGNFVMNALLVVTSVIVILGIVFAADITRLLVPSYAEVEGKLELTTQLTQIMLPFLSTLAVATAMMGMLNSLRRFFMPSLSPAMFNVASIGSMILLVPLMPSFGLQPIVGLAIGTVLGGLGQMALQWPALRKEGFTYRPIISFQDPAVREILRLMGPATLAAAAVQVNVAVNTYLAQGQEQGAVSWLSYAFRLMYLPIGLFGVSIATASLPDISRQAADADLRPLRQTISRGLRLMLMVNVPATIGLIVLARPIIAMIFQRDAFLPRDTDATAAALMAYAPGLIGYSAVKIASPTFFSLRDGRTPVVVSVISILVNLGLNLMLVNVLGYVGLALGTAISAMFNAVTLLFLLRRRMGGIDGRALAIAVLKITLASAVMGAAALAANLWLESVMPGTGEFVKIVRVFAAIALALVTLAIAARVLRIDEFEDATARVLKRIRR